MSSTLTKDERALQFIGGDEVTLFLVDSSYSMSGMFNIDYTSKIVALKKALKEFIELRCQAVANGSNDKFGILTFQNDCDVTMLVDPEDYIAGLINKDRNVIDTITPRGNTPMAAAIETAQGVFTRFPDKFFRIVLISDGDPSDSTLTVRETCVRSFEEYGIVIDTVYIASTFEENERSWDSKAQDLMKFIATHCGGKYTRIGAPDQIKALFSSMESEREALLGHGILLLGDGSN